MRIAVISDIHANLFALEAVLAHAKTLGVKNFWCLGDYIHFNAYPQEVIKTIRKLDLVSIHGNIDRDVLLLNDKNPEERTEKEKLFFWTYQQLSKKSIKYLADLPDSLPVKLKGYRFLLTHGSPVGLDDPIYTDTPDDRLRELSAMTRADVILCGHTHKPFIREVDNRIFINPGSVGKPIDGDPRASYCVLTVKKGSLTIDHYRIEYEIEKAIEAMRQAALPELYIRTMELSMPFNKVEPMLEVKTPEAA
jgi:putative phosphoesterase